MPDATQNVLDFVLFCFASGTYSTSSPSSFTDVKGLWPLVPTSATSGTTNLVSTWDKLCSHHSLVHWLWSIMRTSAFFLWCEMLFGLLVLIQATWTCRGVHSLIGNEEERGSLSVLKPWDHKAAEAVVMIGLSTHI